MNFKINLAHVYDLIRTTAYRDTDDRVSIDWIALRSGSLVIVTKWHHERFKWEHHICQAVFLLYHHLSSVITL